MTKIKQLNTQPSQSNVSRVILAIARTTINQMVFDSPEEKSRAMNEMISRLTLDYNAGKPKQDTFCKKTGVKIALQHYLNNQICVHRRCKIKLDNSLYKFQFVGVLEITLKDMLSPQFTYTKSDWLSFESLSDVPVHRIREFLYQLIESNFVLDSIDNNFILEV